MNLACKMGKNCINMGINYFKLINSVDFILAVIMLWRLRHSYCFKDFRKVVVREELHRRI